MRKSLILVVLAASALAAPAAAKPEAHVGLHAGVLVPQLGAELDLAMAGGLEAGVTVWRRLAPFVGVAYSQPQVDHAASDPRLPAGDYSTSTTQRELTLTVGLQWRFLPASSKANVVAGAGFRAYLLETITNGSAGAESFLENRETSTRYGGVGLVGGELRLGPGAAAVTLEIGGSDLPHLITGDVSTTALSMAVGYRMFFR